MREIEVLVNEKHDISFSSFCAKYNVNSRVSSLDGGISFWKIRNQNGRIFTPHEIFKLGQLWNQYINS